MAELARARLPGRRQDRHAADFRLADDKTPGGPIGQELMYNFIKVQPYWPPD